MTAESWTDSLAEPLRAIAAGRNWRQIQESRDGGWLLLADDLGGDAAWYLADGVNARPRPLSPLEDRKLPAVRRLVSQWLRTGRSVELLAWRVGQRAVFRVRDARGSKIHKVYRHDRSTLLRWTAVEGTVHDRWRTPRVLKWDAGLRCLTVEDCPGQSLNGRWTRGEGLASDGERIADLLYWLAEVRVGAPFPRHSAEDEIAILASRLEVYERTLRTPSLAAVRLTRTVMGRLADTEHGEERFCHRDLHDKQILLGADRDYLIDLDLAAVGPGALDVGNILAHLRLRALTGPRFDWREIAGRIAARAVSARSIQRSLPVWTAAALTRLLLIYVRRRRAPGLLEQLTESALGALERAGEWRTIF